MLSPLAQQLLEPMAHRAKSITQRQFGRTISLYTPLYLSNYCNGGCVYCGIAADRRAKRSVLNTTQLIKELESIKKTGLDEIVLLTGERMPEADVSYLEEAIKIAAKNSNIVGADINELAPIKGFNSYNFLVAKLAYKILSYKFLI